MNVFTVNPAKGVARFLLATAAAAVSEFVVNAILAPFNPLKGPVDAVFWRLFLGSAILVGNAMVFFIRNSRYHGLKLFGLTLLAYVGVAQLLGHVETIAFNFMFHFTTVEIIFMIISQAVTALAFVPLAMLVAGKWAAPEELTVAEPASKDSAPMESKVVPAEDGTAVFPALEAKTFLFRLVILGVLWYFCYMLAGYFIADPITHDYYAAKNPDLPSINAWLPILQFFRGLAWTGLVILGVRIMNRPLAESGLLVGLIYGVFHSSGLLLPNRFMPTEMRLSHLPEIILSQVMFASLAVSVLAYRKKRDQ
jgi:hypothetical protein